jgi:hypothetical protein
MFLASFRLPSWIDITQSSWHFQTEIKGVKLCFIGVEETPSEDDIVRIIHVHHIEGYVLSTSIVKATER